MSNEMTSIEEMAAAADCIVRSEMFPQIKNTAMAMTLMFIAQAEGKSAFSALQRYNIDERGKATLKSEVALAEFCALPGAMVEWKERSTTAAEAHFRSSVCPNGITVRWTIEDAKNAGLTPKMYFDRETKKWRESDPKYDMYRKYPRQMLSARVVAEGIRAVDPRAMHGMRVEGEEETEPDVPHIRMPEAKALPEAAAPATPKVTDAEVVPPKPEATPAGTVPPAAEPPKGQEAPPQAEPPKRKPGRPAKAAPAPAEPPAQPAEAPKPETPPPPQSGTANEYETVVRVIHQAADPAKNRAEAWGFVGESNRAMGTADANLGKVVASLQPEDRVKINYVTIEGKDSAGNPVTRYRLTAIEKVEADGGKKEDGND